MPSASRSLAKAMSERSSAGVIRRTSSGYPRNPPAWMFSTGPFQGGENPTCAKPCRHTLGPGKQHLLRPDR